MKVFIAGGCKSGKSLHAQKIAKRLQLHGKPLYYIATMLPRDYEDYQRVLRHQHERFDWGFKTVEIHTRIRSAANICDIKGAFLLDSITALLANEMFPQNGSVNLDAYKTVARDLEMLVNTVKDIVIVSDYIYSDAYQYDTLTESFRFGLAYIGIKMAEICDVVLEACCGESICYKGMEEFAGVFDETD